MSLEKQTTYFQEGYRAYGEGITFNPYHPKIDENKYFEYWSGWYASRTDDKIGNILQKNNLALMAETL